METTSCKADCDIDFVKPSARFFELQTKPNMRDELVTKAFASGSDVEHHALFRVRDPLEMTSKSDFESVKS